MREEVGFLKKMLLENPFSHLNPEPSERAHILCRMIHYCSHSDGGYDCPNVNTREQNIGLSGSRSLTRLVACPNTYPREQNSLSMVTIGSLVRWPSGHQHQKLIFWHFLVVFFAFS
jgi:hypothetical protein